MEARAPAEATIGSLLCQKRDVFEHARKELPLLPKNGSQVQFPPTFAEAQAIVHSREEDKRKAAARRDKHKQRSSKTKDNSADVFFPGAVPGAEANTTAFWLSTEGYFRDVTEDDLALLCPTGDEPLQDPIFAVPSPWPVFEPEEERQPQGQPRSHNNLKRKREVESQTEPLSPVTSGGAIANGNQLGDTEKQRKSRRLTAKAATKEAESKRVTAGPLVAEPIAENEPAPANEPDGIMPEVTSNGQLAEYLLQTAKEQDVALLTSQILELTSTCTAEVAAACNVGREQLDQWLLAGALHNRIDRPVGEAGLPAEAQIRVHDWIASQAAKLAAAGSRSAYLAGAEFLEEPSILSGLNGALPADKLPESWGAWLRALKEENPRGSDTLAPPRVEALHPYTEMMLHRPPTAYVEKPDALGPSCDGGAATPSALTPTVSGDYGRAAQDATADSAAASRHHVGVPALPVAFGTPFTPGPAAANPGSLLPSSMPRTQTPATGVPVPLGGGLASLVTPATPANGPFLLTPAPELAERLQSHAEAGPSNGGPGNSRGRSNATGKRRTQSLANSLLGNKRQKPAPRLPGIAIDPTRNAITAAVAAHIAAGPQEGDLDAQWQQLEEAAELLALAPDDEVLGEMLALHSELLQQMAINRARAASLVASVLHDLPRQRVAAAQRERCIDVAQTWMAKQRAVKRNVKREKREAAQRDAQKAAEAFLQISPRKAPGRARGLSVDASGPPSMGTTPPPEAPMYDLLAERGAEDEALCAICGGGDSNKLDANEIVFCERCDVAVHQKCYGVDVIPAGEWLCWPCKRFEEGELAAGKSQAQVRAPRWEQGTSKQAGSPNRDLAGGGRSVQCLLCPVRRGAFRQTIDCKHWVHQVCAMWHPETTVWQSSACAAVDGYSEVKSDRWGVECAICHRTEGAIIRCNAGHCATPFHPLCARNNGQHLATRDGGSAGRAVHRAYCALHSDAQREKDIGHAVAMEGPANFMRKEAKIRQHLDRANAAAIEAYEAKYDERKVLTRARLELESLRILLQRINKREKLKRDELRVSYELLRGRMANPDWVPCRPLIAPAAEGDAADAVGRGKRNRGRLDLAVRSPSMQVDREVMMTTGEAAATNDKLPKGFMYVPFHSLKGANRPDQPQ